MKMQQEIGKALDPSQLLEMSKTSPAVRAKLLGLIDNVVERGPIQLRDARLAWDAGRFEESAGLLHAMRGTLGTLGAKSFAAATLELESAIHARHEQLVAGLFSKAEHLLDEIVSEASLLLAKEFKPNLARGEAPRPVVNSRTPSQDTALQNHETVQAADWYRSMQAEFAATLDEIHKLKAEIHDLATERLFDHAVAALPSCLVVEDDDLIAQVLVHLLTREGYRVQRCCDGRAARQFIENAVEPPGLILLDVMLPYADGFELIQVIREEKRWTGVPIVMLTAKQQENDVVRALDAGATDYVIKPFQPNELMARLRRILRLKG